MVINLKWKLQDSYIIIGDYKYNLIGKKKEIYCSKYGYSKWFTIEDYNNLILNQEKMNSWNNTAIGKCIQMVTNEWDRTDLENTIYSKL